MQSSVFSFTVKDSLTKIGTLDNRACWDAGRYVEMILRRKIYPMYDLFHAQFILYILGTL